MNSPLDVLIIDDNLDDHHLCRRSLAAIEDQVFNVRSAFDGLSGLAELTKGRTDVVLLDYSLPGANGLAVLQNLKAKRPFLPVILMTGQGSEAVAVEAMKGGAQDYINKAAIKPNVLERVIHNSMETCALQKQIKSQNDALDLFTRALTHDLKEPIRAIRSYADLAARPDMAPDRSAAYLGRIIGAAASVDRLIDMVRTLSGLSHGDSLTPHGACDLNAVLHEVEQALGALIEERGAQVLYAPLPVVRGNPEQLQLLFQNLISNAIYHAGHDKPIIHVTCAPSEEGFVFGVEDNGPGVPAAFRERVFEAFQHFSRTVKGSGLGLAIAKKIVDLHGGWIRCLDAPLGGALFQFVLPAVAASDADAAVEAIKAQPTVVRPANVLIVDDNEIDLELARILLFDVDHMNFNMMTAGNGGEALQTLTQREPADIDLVLLDLNMPVLGGMEFLDRLRDMDAVANIPVVVCSTSNYKLDLQRAQQLGAVGYIEKPISLAKLKHVLGGRQELRLVETGEETALERVMH